MEFDFENMPGHNPDEEDAVASVEAERHQGAIAPQPHVGAEEPEQTPFEGGALNADMVSSTYGTQENPGLENPEMGHSRTEQEIPLGGTIYGGAPRGNEEPKTNPYQKGYYRPTAYGNGYPQGQIPCYGGNYVPLIREVAYTPAAPYAPHKPVVQKNHKLLCSLILGILAMGILNFMPFVAFILSLIALCTGYSGLKQGEISKGKRVCGYVGLALGIIGLILSVTMLTMLLTLSLRATEKLSNSANGMIR